MNDWQKLQEAAQVARDNAHAPYSGFSVGSALETVSGEIFVGANVENSSYPVTVCAERSAVQAAVSAGHREFRRILVLTSTSPPASPCGACRQVLAEFADDLPIRLVNVDGEVEDVSLSELLPRRFRWSGPKS